ncbi:hypothetical protein ACFRI7_02110 [Streptomyces sp. NPDC056716]|uniref:hypothetical protein n=1 Tax=unclassified Streptomyces TaxID=2593676 RepID=UPI003679D051
MTNALWGSLVALAGLLTVLGMDSARLFVALDDHPWLTLLAPALAITAVALCFHAYFAGQRPLLIFGSTACIASLAASLIIATLAAGGNGGPAVTNVGLKGQRPHISLTFTVHAVGEREKSQCTTRSPTAPACVTVRLP